MYYNNKTKSMLFYCMCSANDWFFTESVCTWVRVDSFLPLSMVVPFMPSSLWLVGFVSLYTIINIRARIARARGNRIGSRFEGDEYPANKVRKEGVKPFSDSDFCILHKKGKNRHFLLPSQKKNLPLPTINLYSTIYILWIRKLSSLAW